MMDVVAEMMILANAAVADALVQAFPGAALLRNHPPPRREAFEQASRAAGQGGGRAWGALLQPGPAALRTSTTPGLQCTDDGCSATSCV